ncbi:LOW QUALITY PROTEIN: hypothetical protein PHMEG_00017192 [Phytophthora megakarya]|uniref:glucan endo-1,3-beta-D-glucosidase n=1 Tax=Phytophthora megakarya TaxID=4795 RepID=A0A225VY09_9STRA|nr:LOW QUALITY PROTEIN: hypothetical protein PHMEG_00017192 [Phytophthora megakarya]
MCIYFPRFRHFSWFSSQFAKRRLVVPTRKSGAELGVKPPGSVTFRGSSATCTRTVSLRWLTTRMRKSDPKFVPNHVTGIFFDNKADCATWYSAEKYCNHGIQMIVVSPRAHQFIKDEWDNILSKASIIANYDRTDVLLLLEVNQAVIDPTDALSKLAMAKMDDSLTRSYNAASRMVARR